MTRTLVRSLAVLLIVGLGFTAYMYRVALSDPVVRQDQLAVADWPKDAPPVRILIASDLHIAGPDMPPERVAKLVRQMNALKPDLILFAGDFVSDKRTATRYYSAQEGLAPLGQLKASLGKIAVMGNHDHWRDVSAIEEVLRAGGFTILDNDAVTAGPLAVGGVDDDFTGRDDVGKMTVAMQPLTGIPIVVSHSPDVVPDLPADIVMVAAGHTHCGQIQIPGLDSVPSVSRYGRRYACGKITEANKAIFVGAGLGTSILPLRLGAVPDLWLVTMGPHARTSARISAREPRP